MAVPGERAVLALRRGTEKTKGFTSSVLVTTNKALVTRSDALVPSSFLFLVVRPGAPSSVLAPSSDALVTSSFFVFFSARPLAD